MSVSMVTGVFESERQAGAAADDLRQHGLRDDEISVVSRKEKTDSKKTDNISDGLLAGGAIGGLAGILAGAGTIAIPGLGIMAAAGPITGLFSGLATGSLLGGLIDLGIPEKKGKEYEKDVKDGKILFSMKTDKDKAEEVVSILKRNGAEKVEYH